MCIFCFERGEKQQENKGGTTQKEIFRGLKGRGILAAAAAEQQKNKANSKVEILENSGSARTHRQNHHTLNDIHTHTHMHPTHIWETNEGDKEEARKERKKRQQAEWKKRSTKRNPSKHQLGLVLSFVPFLFLFFFSFLALFVGCFCCWCLHRVFVIVAVT